MKKRIGILIVLIAVFLALTACQLGTGTGQSETSSEKPETSSQEKEALQIRIAGLKGPTSMGLVHLLDQAEQNKAANDYSFSIHGSADEVTPKLIQGELDIAAVPANLASVLYNNTNGSIKVLAVNTLGVLYIVEKGDTVDSIEDLRGQTIYCTGKGSTPEYNLRYLLKENGIDPDKDVKLEWKSEPTEVVALLSQAESGIAMLPQPYVTVAQSKLQDLNIVVDLNQEWANLGHQSLMITGVLVVRSDFAGEHPKEISDFLDEYKSSTEFINTNIAEGATLVEKFNIVNADVAKKAIPYCNITFMEGTQMKTAMEGYLNVLYEQNAKSVGGKLPEEGFYYERQ